MKSLVGVGFVKWKQWLHTYLWKYYHMSSVLGHECMNERMKERAQALASVFSCSPEPGRVSLPTVGSFWLFKSKPCYIRWLEVDQVWKEWWWLSGAGTEDSCLKVEFCSWVSHCAHTSCGWTTHLTVVEMGYLRRCVFCHNEKLKVVGWWERPRIPAI